MKVDQIKIGIVGGGNIGRFLSTLLMSHGYDVELVCRNNHRAIKIDNSYVFEIRGDFGKKSYLVPFVEKIEDLSTKKDIIIFTTKSFNMLDKVSSSLQKLTPKGMIVTIQNVFSLDKLYKLIPPEASVCMICDFACCSHNKITYVKDCNGVTLGVYNKKAINRMKLLSKIFSKFMKVNIAKDIVGFIMSRNIINGAISILGGISGLNLNELLSSYKGRKLFERAIEETYKVCRRYRINVLPYNNQLDYEKFVSKTISGWFYRQKIFKLLRKYNGNIKSSALDDLEHGQRTEIRCLLDSIIEFGKKSKTNIDCIVALDNTLRDIEQGKLNIHKSNISKIYNKLLFSFKQTKKSNI